MNNVSNFQQDVDPQIVVSGTIKEARNGGEIITFSVTFMFFTLSCIVNVPREGETTAPVFIRGKMCRNFFPDVSMQSPPHYPQNNNGRGPGNRE
jgi:hypothetical protein